MRASHSVNGRPTLAPSASGDENAAACAHLQAKLVVRAYLTRRLLTAIYTTAVRTDESAVDATLFFSY